MDIGRSFTYMFDDEKWVEKLAIGGLLVLASIIPLVNIFTGLVILGYTLRLIKNVSQGDPNPLPAWDQWGEDWKKGLMVALASLIYSIPIILATGFTSIVTSVATNSSGELEGFWGICVAGLSCLSSLWGLAVGIVFPAAMLKYVEEGEFGSFFKFGEIFRFIGDNLGNYVIALLLIVVARIVGALGVILCIIGVFFTVFWSALVSGHLLGQVKANAKSAPMMPAPPAAPIEPSQQM